jgi:hypothetical protein
MITLQRHSQFQIRCLHMMKERKKQRFVEKILRSMISIFNNVVCYIKESNDVFTLSIDDLQNNLLVREARMNTHKEKYDEQALKMLNSWRGYGHVIGRVGATWCGRGRQARELVECYKRHKLGHYKIERPNWDSENANFVDSEESLLLAQEKVSTTIKEEVWFLDSSCSNHMIGNKD